MRSAVYHTHCKLKFDADGYKDTVEDGVEGFRIPTIAPEPGLEGDLAYRHDLEIDTYDMYCGFSSSFVGVNTQSLADAFSRLVEDKNLRLSMGAAGRQKIKTQYDWCHIIKSYEDFWDELSDLREHNKKFTSQGNDAVRQLSPNRLDPTAAFAHYPTENLNLNTHLSLMSSDKKSAIDMVNAYRELVLVNYVHELMPNPEMVSELINNSSENPIPVKEILNAINPEFKHLAKRSLTWLIKMGVYKF